MGNQLEIIKQLGLQILPMSDILLFGSRARKDFSEESDFDLLFITEDELSSELKRFYKAQLRKLLAKQKIPVDILIESKHEIEVKKEITGHIIRMALKDSIKL